DALDFAHFALLPARHLFERLARMQVPVAFEVRCLVESEAPLDGLVLAAIEQALDLLLVPHVEAAFVTFRVRVEARVVTAGRGLHLAQHPVRYAARDVCKEMFTRRSRRVRVEREQGAV